LAGKDETEQAREGRTAAVLRCRPVLTQGLDMRAGDSPAGAVMLDGDSLAGVQAPSFQPLLIISSDWSEQDQSVQPTCK
jgi:hypothetical protein